MRETQRTVVRTYTELPSIRKLERKEKRRRVRKLLMFLNNAGYMMMGFGLACMIFGCGRMAHAVVAVVAK